MVQECRIKAVIMVGWCDYRIKGQFPGRGTASWRKVDFSLYIKDELYVKDEHKYSILVK